MKPELQQAVERLRYRANMNIAGGSCADEDYDTLAIIAALEQAEADQRRRDAETVRWVARHKHISYADSQGIAGIAAAIEAGTLTVPHGKET